MDTERRLELIERKGVTQHTTLSLPMDIVEFAEQYVVTDNGTPILLEEHQKRILRAAFTLDENGKLPYKTIVYSAPKKSGKTEVNAIVVTWFAFTVDSPNEIILCANDEEQAQGRVFRAVKRIIESNPVLLKNTVKIVSNEIVLSNGTTIRALASEYAGAAGSNHGLSSWDELWGYTSERSRRLFDELTPVPTRRNSIRFISTYAGFIGESNLLEDVYNRGLKGKRLFDDLPVYTNKDLFVYWDTESRMPWQTAEYYQSERESLRHSSFLRFHCNEWVSSESSFFDMDKWDACVDAEHKPPMPSKAMKLFVGVDASTKRDRAAVVSVYFIEEGHILLGPKRYWQPSKKNPLDLEQTLEKYLMDLSKNFTVVVVYYDPHQFHRSATTLKKFGINVQEFLQTPANLGAMGRDLFDLIEYERITIYPDEDLKREASMAIAKENSSGEYLIKKMKASHKIDSIIALAMACHALQNYRPALLPMAFPITNRPAFTNAVQTMFTGEDGDPFLRVLVEGQRREDSSQWDSYERLWVDDFRKFMRQK